MKLMRIVLLFALIALFVPVHTASAAPPFALPPNCQYPVPGANGDVYLICFPADLSKWNGGLVVFAHGYVPPQVPLDIPWEQMVTPDGSTTLYDMVNNLGFAFAASSYRKNGLAVQEGLQDTRAMITFIKTQAPVKKVYLVGASEGGLITTLGIERYPAEFAAGMAICGPLGDFRRQINYWGDFRTLFDVYFKDVLPGSSTGVPSALILDWISPTSIYKAKVLAALQANPARTLEFLRVARVPVDTSSATAVGTTVIDILNYNILATNEAFGLLGVQPYDNTRTWYSGSSNDWLLNRAVRRYSSSGNVTAALAPYQTSGVLSKSLITMHTIGDPIVPVWHQSIYRLKVLSTGSLARYTGIPISRYGHCNFTANELLVGFGLMLVKTAFQPAEVAAR